MHSPDHNDFIQKGIYLLALRAIVSRRDKHDKQ